MVFVRKGNGKRSLKCFTRCCLREAIWVLSHTLLLLMVFAKKVIFKKHLQLLDAMVQIGNQHDEITYDTPINGFCKAGNLEKAMELLQEMSDKGCRCNLVTEQIELLYRWSL